VAADASGGRRADERRRRRRRPEFGRGSVSVVGAELRMVFAADPASGRVGRVRRRRPGAAPGGLYYRGSSTKSLHRNPATQPGRGPATCRHRAGDLAGWVNRCPVGWRGRTASWASWVPRSPGPARTIRRCSGCRCVAGHLPGPRSPAPARDVLRSAPACLTDAGDGRVSRLASGIAHDVPVVRPSSAPGSVRGQASARDRLRRRRHGGTGGPGRSDADGPGREAGTPEGNG
jgi:hypothetical protein